MTDQKYLKIQKQFLQKVEDLLPKENSIVFELSELLGLSTDSVYRRMRGETMMTLDEIVCICNKFNISFESFSRSEKGLVTFRYSDTEPSFKSFKNYLSGMYEDMVKIASYPGGRIIYAAEDIPIFYHYGFGEIASFKFFYWLKSVSNVPELQNAKYNSELLDPEIKSISEKIYELYMKIPSVEIWTENTVVGAVKQIEYYWESGFFSSKDDAIKVCESLEMEVSSICNKAEKSCKLENECNDTGGNYLLYSSDVEIANNCVLVDLGENKAVYLGHLTFYTLTTYNKEYCNITSAWLDTLMKKSTLISGVSEKQRLRFFKKAFKLIGDLKEKIIKES